MKTDMENLSYDFFMSQFTVISDIKENEKIKLSIILFKRTQSTCILRICKNRDLTAVCEAIAQVKNPNLAYIVDYIYAKGNTYIIEEKLSGLTVEEYLEENGVLSEKKTAEIIISVCNGLTELHKMKPPIIHNDINPSNIMICDDSNIKLFDFDVSRTYKNESSQNTELFGTDKYASPEHYGYGQSDARSDIYCLGVTMHKMLTDKYLTGTHKCIYKGKLKKIIEKCIEFDPKNRYSSVQLLKADLQRFLAKKTRILTVCITILCLCVGVGSMIYVLKDNNSSNTAQDITDTFIDQKEYNNSNDDIITDISANSDTGNNTDIDSFVTNNDTVNDELNNDTENNTQEPISKNEQKTMKTISIDGEVLSMVALNDGTFVYLEKISEEYHVKTSSGIDNELKLSVSDDKIELAYNSFTDTLYTVTVDGELANIYLINRDFSATRNPIYSATRSAISDITTGFFSDGIMYCNAFDFDLVDTEQWCAISEFSNGENYYIANDKIYYIYSNRIYEKDTNKETVTNTWIPMNLNGDNGYSDNSYLYISCIYDNKTYIYRFDGREFTEVICMNDYKYYSTVYYLRIFAVSEDRVWIYDEDSKSIKEFTIK